MLQWKKTRLLFKVNIACKTQYMNDPWNFRYRHCPVFRLNVFSSPQYIHLRGRSSTRQIKKKIMLSTKTKICFGLLTICLALVNCRTVRTRTVSEATRWDVKNIDTNLVRINSFLKVSKSQKLFFLKLHCPKKERNIRQNSALWS